GERAGRGKWEINILDGRGRVSMGRAAGAGQGGRFSPNPIASPRAAHYILVQPERGRRAAGPRGLARGCGLGWYGRVPMKAAKILLGVALVFSLVLVARADDKGKEKTIKGTITCAKCDLKLAKGCHTVIKDKGGTVYWFDKTSPNYKDNHKQICTA